MSADYINLTPDNLATEHLCCAIADKKHQRGVDAKRTWLAERLPEQGKSGVCVLSANKKKPFLTEKKFVQRYGFDPADTVGEYELMALSFDGTKPRFADNAKKQGIDSELLTIYCGKQCPYISNCINEVQAYCSANGIPLELIEVDTLEKAKAVPCVFNNWAVFYKGELMTLHLLNEGHLKKMLES